MRSLGLYLHVPFCRRACPYCDFDFVVGRRADASSWLEGLEAERLERAEELRETLFVDPHTLYLGGGTPSVLGPEGLRRTFDWVRLHWPDAGREETTIEANPEDVDATFAEACVEAGVHRVSLGVQSFSPEGLRELGRVHDAERASLAVELLAASGLQTSLDLIVGWPGQDEARLERDLEAAIASEAEHLSVYALTIEEGSAWPKLVGRGVRRMPDEDRQADLLERAHGLLGAAGYHHYEVSSYARAGARARHNESYWRWCDYVGLGPSAASARFDASGVVRRTNARGLDAWRRGAPPSLEVLGPLEAAIEGLWTGLRRLDGVEIQRFLRRFPAVDEAWVRRRVALSVRRGVLAWSDGGQRVAAAPGAWTLLDFAALDLVESTPGARGSVAVRT